MSPAGEAGASVDRCINEVWSHSRGSEDAVKLTQALERVTTVGDVQGLAQRCVEVTGFASFAFSFMMPNPPREPTHLVIGTFPKEWYRPIEEHRQYIIDPIALHAFSSSLPVIWDEVHRDHAGVKEFLTRASMCNLAHGVSETVMGRQGDIGMFSVSRPDPVPSCEQERIGTKQSVYCFSAVIHNAMHRLAFDREKGSAYGTLTTRQKDCLMWARQRLTSAEIARRLFITEWTVLFHLGEAGKRLGVSGRHRILAKAISVGQLQLELQTYVAAAVMGVHRDVQS